MKSKSYSAPPSYSFFTSRLRSLCFFFFFLNDTAPPEISPLPLPDAFPISGQVGPRLLPEQPFGRGADHRRVRGDGAGVARRRGGLGVGVGAGLGVGVGAGVAGGAVRIAQIGRAHV